MKYQNALHNNGHISYRLKLRNIITTSLLGLGLVATAGGTFLNLAQVQETALADSGSIVEIVNDSMASDEWISAMDSLYNPVVESACIESPEEIEAIRTSSGGSDYVEPKSYGYDNSYTSSNNYVYTGSKLTKSGGINYLEDGTLETYYSSNVLRHYKINEWHTNDDDNVWRDENERVIVAADGLPMGTIVETSYGEGIVQDRIGNSDSYEGHLDLYVAW